MRFVFTMLEINKGPDKHALINTKAFLHTYTNLPWIGLHNVIVVFPSHTHFFLFKMTVWTESSTESCPIR